MEKRKKNVEKTNELVSYKTTRVYSYTVSVGQQSGHHLTGSSAAGSHEAAIKVSGGLWSHLKV